MEDCIPVDAETAARVRFAARVHDLTESEVVTRAVQMLAAPKGETIAPARDQWTPLAVYGEFDGVRVDGEFVPATKRLAVTSGANTGKAFKSPSAAARAVIAALKPERGNTPVNGWRFWRLTDTHERLDALR